MEKTDIEHQKEIDNRKFGKFRESHIFVRISFIIGIIVLILTAVQIFAGATLLYYFGYRLSDGSKLPLYLICSVILVFALIGTIFGGFTLRGEKNVYGILGFIFNVVILLSQIFLLVVIITAG